MKLNVLTEVLFQNICHVRIQWLTSSQHMHNWINMSKIYFQLYAAWSNIMDTCSLLILFKLWYHCIHNNRQHVVISSLQQSLTNTLQIWFLSQLKFNNMIIILTVITWTWCWPSMIDLDSVDCTSQISRLHEMLT